MEAQLSRRIPPPPRIAESACLDEEFQLWVMDQFKFALSAAANERDTVIMSPASPRDPSFPEFNADSYARDLFYSPPSPRLKASQDAGSRSLKRHKSSPSCHSRDQVDLQRSDSQVKYEKRYTTLQPRIPPPIEPISFDESLLLKRRVTTRSPRSNSNASSTSSSSSTLCRRLSFLEQDFTLNYIRQYNKLRTAHPGHLPKGRSSMFCDSTPSSPTTLCHPSIHPFSSHWSLSSTIDAHQSAESIESVRSPPQEPAKPERTGFSLNLKWIRIPAASWRHKKLLIRGIALEDDDGFHSIKRWCEGFGALQRIGRQSNGDIHVHFRKKSVAETVCRIDKRVYIKGAGSVVVSWFTGRKPSS